MISFQNLSMLAIILPDIFNKNISHSKNFWSDCIWLQWPRDYHIAIRTVFGFFNGHIGVLLTIALYFASYNTWFSKVINNLYSWQRDSQHYPVYVSESYGNIWFIWDCWWIHLWSNQYFKNYRKRYTWFYSFLNYLFYFLR